MYEPAEFIITVTHLSVILIPSESRVLPSRYVPKGEVKADWALSSESYEHNCAVFVFFFPARINVGEYLHGEYVLLFNTLQWIIKAARRVELSVLSDFSSERLAPASLSSSSSSDRRLFSLSSKDSRSSVESSAVLSLLSSASAGPSLVSARGERTLELGSRASPRSLVIFPSSRRLWTMLWGC